MKIKTLALSSLLAIGLAGTAAAAPVDKTLDLTGLITDGAAPSVFNFAEPTALTYGSISWDFTFEAFSPSWGSEAGFNIAAPDGTLFTLGTDGNACATCDYNFGFPDASGVYMSADSIDISMGSPYGIGQWTITIFESFDDAGPDGQFLEGYIKITGDDDGSHMGVPEPGILALFGLGLLGMIGARRRRV